MNIIQAMSDKNLFRGFLADGKDSLASWNAWNTALRCLYGLPLKPRHQDLIKHCTGRDYDSIPTTGFDVALFLTGRRSGKSRIASTIACYESVLTGAEAELDPGERGMVLIISPTVKQSRIVKRYCRALFGMSPMLEEMIERETKEGFDLNNGVSIEILVSDWRSVRGYTMLAVVVDEICFMGTDAESKVRSDTELVRALLPALATTGGKLIGISSPYAKRGWAFNQHKKYWGKNNAPTLVWACSSRTMNQTLPQRIVDRAMAEDRQAALAEYGGKFRDDVSIWLPLEIIESVVKRGRFELLPRTGESYHAFCDISGGRFDDAALAIAHKNGKVVVDYIKRYKPPHSPYDVIGDMSEQCKKFGLKRITGDNYSAEFVSQAFKQQGLAYEKSALNKSQLYLELLPCVCSHSIELLDDKVSINELANLERKTRSGGRDIVDHPQGGHDDSANAVAGVNFVTGREKKKVGGLW